MRTMLLFLGNLGGGELMLILLVVFPIFGIVHFIPSIIGFRRPDRLLIFLVNLLAGWSVIGWFVALYLALRKAPVPNPFSTSTSQSVADELAKLRDLRDQGILTQVEFEHQKNNLIS